MMSVNTMALMLIPFSRSSLRTARLSGPCGSSEIIIKVLKFTVFCVCPLRCHPHPAVIIIEITIITYFMHVIFSLLT